ncbi:MAG TPA: alpha/beta fold hydrolase [Candidatus Acidoferrum sp.]|nr:alpha/beta fold hydrolase [Candidatus Acidoferrum sp.]
MTRFAGAASPRLELPRIEIDGVRVAYAEAGRGETVLLLHSSASSSAQWRALTEILQARWRVLAPDLHGYGQTDQRRGPPSPGLTDEAALAGAVLDDAERIHLVGHSFGGAVALRLAAERPERLLSLTLVEPVAFHLLRGAPAGAAEHQLYREVAELAADVTQAAEEEDGRRGMARFVDYWNGAGAWLRMRPDLQSALALQAARVALDFHATMTEPMRPEALQRIAAPTLILRGSASPRPTRRIAALLARLLPNAHLQTIEGAGHMLPLTHAAAVNAAIAEQLSHGTAARPRLAAI